MKTFSGGETTTTIINIGGEPQCVIFKVDKCNAETNMVSLDWAGMLDLKTHIDNKLRRMKEKEALDKAPKCYSDTDCKGKMVGGSWSRMDKCNVCGHQEIPY